MSSNEIEIGPVDFLIVEWPVGKEPDGKGLEEVVKLSDRGIIRVIDLAFVRKETDGTVTGLSLADFESDDLGDFHGASTGLLTQSDYDEAGEALEPGTSAAILVWENKWAAPFVRAIRNNGAQVVATGRIPVDDLLKSLDAIDAAQV